METAWLIAVIIFGSLITFFLIVIGLPIFLYHRREVMKMKGVARNETSSLGERVAALEERCNKLDERITEAHLLLADEQRQMDRKLSAILSDPPAIDSREESKGRGGEAERTP